MSIWSFDLGIDPNWPDWFKAHRSEWDAAIRAKAEEERSLGRPLTSDEVRAWGLEEAERHRQWREALSADQRAWLEAQESDDELTARVPTDPDRNVDLERLLGELGRKR